MGPRHRLLASIALTFLVAASFGSPAVAQKKAPECGELETGWGYSEQLMKVTFTFDIRNCEFVPRRVQGPYLSQQPDFVLVAILIHDDTLSASLVPETAICFRAQLRCKVTLRFEHFPIERATYTATAVLTSLKSPFANAGAFYARCSSVYMTTICGL